MVYGRRPQRRIRLVEIFEIALDYKVRERSASGADVSSRGFSICIRSSPKRKEGKSLPAKTNRKGNRTRLRLKEDK